MKFQIQAFFLDFSASTARLLDTFSMSGMEDTVVNIKQDLRIDITPPGPFKKDYWTYSNEQKAQVFVSNSKIQNSDKKIKIAINICSKS